MIKLINMFFSHFDVPALSLGNRYSVRIFLFPDREAIRETSKLSFSHLYYCLLDMTGRSLDTSFSDARHYRQINV